MRLTTVKTLHTALYLLQVAAILCILVAGITGRRIPWLRHAFALTAIESAVFLGNGRRCPLTTLAKRWGDPKGYVGDTFFSERCTRHTFSLFGSLLGLGTALVFLRRLRGQLR